MRMAPVQTHWILEFLTEENDAKALNDENGPCSNSLKSDTEITYWILQHLGFKQWDWPMLKLSDK